MNKRISRTTTTKCAKMTDWCTKMHQDTLVAKICVIIQRAAGVNLTYSLQSEGLYHGTWVRVLCGMFQMKNPTSPDYPVLVGFFYVPVSLSLIRLFGCPGEIPPKKPEPLYCHYGISLRRWRAHIDTAFDGGYSSRLFLYSVGDILK